MLPPNTPFAIYLLYSVPSNSPPLVSKTTLTGIASNCAYNTTSFAGILNESCPAVVKSYQSPEPSLPVDQYLKS